ncbi:YebC/PmpR family DNA-binding transcriptional regulator [Candidatus Woesebacteria bacterium]|nr:YebC/PmpR family DNA-binding transcriptional regulator [Candidatus Woesebacteria bacterium]
MAGHSKWNNIKNRKGAADSKRAKAFAQISKLIRIAVKEGKSDNPQFNPTLRTILEKARAANMPNENIKRAIDRGMGRGPGGPIQEITYEGFAPHGVAVLVYAVTNNPTRTGGEIRHLFTKHGGSLGGPGTAHYLFEKKEGILIPMMPMDLEEVAYGEVSELIEALESYDDVEEVVSTLAQPPEEIE